MGLLRLSRFSVALVQFVVLGFALLCGYTQSDPWVMWYRVSTSMAALHAVFTLPQSHIDEFIGSYEIFDKEKIESANDTANIVNYYKVLNHLCAVGEVEKMYIPPVMDKSKSVFWNQVRWEEVGMADKLDVGPGKKVLDVGCGRGRIAHHVAKHTGAHVTGINLDPSQLEMAKGHAAVEKMLGEQLEFLRANYNERFPFNDEEFDALYHVQALTYAESLPKLFAEMHRILKPGAKISFLDWFALPAFKPEDTHHQHLLKEVKALIGAVRTPYPEEYQRALEEAGFVVLLNEEASTDGDQQFPLIQDAQTFFEFLLKPMVDKLTVFGLLPKHFKVLVDRLTYGGDSFVEADRLRLFTTSWQIIAQKPLK